MSAPLVLAISLAAPLAADAPPASEDLGPAREYRILYAGPSGTDREQAFLDFLRGWFARVDAIDLKRLTPDAASDYDVVVADWKRRYSPDGGFASDDGSSFPSARAGIGPEFTKPIVMIGAVAGEIQHHSKIDWL